MHSSLIHNRSIAFSPDAEGAAGGGAAVVEQSADEIEQPEGETKEGDTKDDEPKDERPEWKKRLDALAEKDKAGKEGKDGKKEGDAAAAGKGGKPADDDTDETKPFLVKLPGRKADDPDVEIPIDRAKMKELGLTVKDVRDRMGQLRNSYKRTAEVETARTEISEGRAQLDEIVTEMRERPTEFFLDNVTPEHYAPLVTSLIARMSDADFKKVVQRVAEYDADGSRRRTEGSDSRDKQHERKQEREQTQTAEKKRTEYVKAVTTEINNVIPEDWDDDRAEELFEYATFKLKQHAAKQRAGGNTKGIAPSEIPALLKSLGVLSHFDLEEPQATRRPTAPSSSARSASPRKPAASGKPKDTATDLQERRETRRIATTTPGGAGGAAQGGPPKGQTFAERMKYIRDKFGVTKK